jgi:DNA-binding NarL/FixJ family response regulator
MKKIKVVLVDDEPYNRDIIEDLLQDNPSISFVGYVEEEASFKELVKNTDPDIALLDITLFSSEGGMDLLKWLLKEMPNVKPIMMTASEEKISECYQIGAQGYIVKGNWSDVVPTILNVYRGDTVVPNSIARNLVKQIKGEKQILHLKDELKQFTLREREILSHMKQGVPRNTIIQKMQISSFTFKRHLQNIRKKSLSSDLQSLLDRYKDVL